MTYDIGLLSLDTLIAPVAKATEVLVRLDERLARSPVRDGFVERQNFADAAAALLLEGELVHLEDLVLHDAHMDVRTRPTSSPARMRCCEPAAKFLRSSRTGRSAATVLWP